MIVPMKKVTLLVLGSEKERSLQALRSFGAVHVQLRECASEQLAELHALDARCVQAIALVTDAQTKNVTRGEECRVAGQVVEAAEAVEQIVRTHSDRVELAQRIAQCIAHLERCEPWGDFDPADVRALAQRGIHLIPVELSERSYRCLPDELQTLCLARRGGLVRCVLVADKPGLPPSLPADARALELPDVSPADLFVRLRQLREECATLTQRLLAYSEYQGAIRALRQKIAADIEFERVHLSMVSVDVSQWRETGETLRIAHVSGYLPVSRVRAFSECARKEAWAYCCVDPMPEDPVPTQLRNNRWVNLISPLMNFLGTVPGYWEVDISGFFLLFFGVFFSIIFADAGYGAVLTLVSLGGIVLSKRKHAVVSPAWCLGLYLGTLTMVWGALVCNWFGVPVQYVPASLARIAVWEISGFADAAQRNKNQMHVCFFLGLLHLCLGHLIVVRRTFRSLRVLAEFGSLLMLGGMYVVVLNLIVDKERYPLTGMIVGSIIAGFVLNFIFVNYRVSVRQSVADSMKNVINALLGIVNVFADVMSYIRLWAVGLAGGAISATVNEMTHPLFANFLAFLGIVLLLFGHGLNYVMSILSVIVHGVRLNTLEFSNHVGLMWTGIRYTPFRER